MNSKHPHYDTIVAWAEGKTIQVWCDGGHYWYDWTSDDAAPLFYRKNRYRVKPEPLHDWVWRRKGSIMGWALLRSATESHMKARFPKEDFEYRMLVPVTEED